MKKTITIPKEFAEYVVKNGSEFRGARALLTFPNGYSASIIHHEFSYGLEMAIKIGDELCYNTEITNDVISYISGTQELAGYLERVKNLPNAPGVL